MASPHTSEFVGSASGSGAGAGAGSAPLLPGTDSDAGNSPSGSSGGGRDGVTGGYSLSADQELRHRVLSQTITRNHRAAEADRHAHATHQTAAAADQDHAVYGTGFGVGVGALAVLSLALGGRTFVVTFATLAFRAGLVMAAVGAVFTALYTALCGAARRSQAYGAVYRGAMPTGATDSATADSAGAAAAASSAGVSSADGSGSIPVSAYERVVHPFLSGAVFTLAFLCLSPALHSWIVPHMSLLGRWLPAADLHLTGLTLSGVVFGALVTVAGAVPAYSVCVAQLRVNVSVVVQWTLQSLVQNCAAGAFLGWALNGVVSVHST